MSDTGDRLRQPPTDRLGAPSASFDLLAMAEDLRKEGSPSHQGHRQKVLARHGQTTVALFVFDDDASLAPHAADGTVIIQCIAGELALTADDTPETLGPGRLLVLAPRVRHSVRAVQRSVMLLTVALQRKA